MSHSGSRLFCAALCSAFLLAPESYLLPLTRTADLDDPEADDYLPGSTDAQDLSLIDAQRGEVEVNTTAEAGARGFIDAERAGVRHCRQGQEPKKRNDEDMARASDYVKSRISVLFLERSLGDIRQAL